MKSITEIQELKKLQMDILLYVDSFCRENGLKYSLSGGSLIGAVRHRGYIPWDDDIDILLRREDYDKLITMFSKIKHPYYSVYSSDTTKLYTLPFAKIVDTRTVLKEPGLPFEMGVNIDLFPFDFISDDEKECARIVKKAQRVRNWYVLKRLEWDNQRSLIKNIVLTVGKIVLAPVSLKLLSNKINQIARKAGMPNDTKRACLVWGYGQREVMPSAIFDEYVDMPFEEATFMALKDYKTYLTNLFGDYMQLPPIEKRITHHEFVAYWK